VQLCILNKATALCRFWLNKDAVKIIKPTTKVKDFIKPDMIICLLYRYSALSVPESWQNA
jgi:hypothetical protein